MEQLPGSTESVDPRPPVVVWAVATLLLIVVALQGVVFAVFLREGQDGVREGAQGVNPGTSGDVAVVAAMVPHLVFFVFCSFLTWKLVRGRPWARNVSVGMAALLIPGALLSGATGRAAIVPKLGFVACVSILLLLATPQARAFFREPATPGSPAPQPAPGDNS